MTQGFDSGLLWFPRLNTVFSALCDACLSVAAQPLVVATAQATAVSEYLLETHCSPLQPLPPVL
jgi:hypothetical protein